MEERVFIPEYETLNVEATEEQGSWRCLEVFNVSEEKPLVGVRNVVSFEKCGTSPQNAPW